MSYKYMSLLLAGAASLAVVAPADTAMAQENSDANADEAVAEDSEPGAIIVQGRRRSERLQEVPEAITFLSESKIQEARIQDVRDLAEELPSVSLNYSFRQSIIRINSRGFSTPQFGDAPVAYVVDGFAVTDLDFISQGIFDVESIEVLRGPQGALYGRGALQGAILINTKKPTNDVSGTVQASYGSGDDIYASASISGPIVRDNVYFRIAGYHHNRNGQLVNDLGDKLDFVEDSALRASLLFTPTDNLEITLSGRLSDGDFGTAQVITDVPYTEYDNDDFYETVNQDYVGQNERFIAETNLSIVLDTEIGEFISLTGYSYLEDTIFADADFSLANGGVQADYSERASFSQELRFTSPDHRPLRYIIGGIYQDRNWDRIYTSGLPVSCNTCEPDFEPRSPATVALIAPERKSYNLGAYASVNYDITDRLELGAALRYDADHRENIDRPTSAAAGFPADFKLEETFSMWQPKVSLAYEASDDVLVYASASRGFRSGGFNALNFTFQPGIYQQEESETAELGMKSTLFNGVATLNLAAYISRADNYQRSLFDFASNTLGIQNIDEVNIRGFEVEANANITDNLSFNLAFGYVDTEIENFSDVDEAVAVARATAELGGLSQAEVDAAGDAAFARTTAENAASNGNRAPYIPSTTLNIGLRHEADINNDLSLISNVSLRQLGEIVWEPDNTDARSSAKENLSARVAVESVEGWTISVYGDNLLDQRRPVDQFVWNPGVSGAVNPNKPRSFGASFRYEF